MDPDVEKALARWPNVPVAYGWLSLDPRGRWRLHPQGDAAAGGPGEPISNPQILAFIGRNYAPDERGCWYFQNGPQRVYVRLDAAPYILRRAPDTAALQTHTGLDVRAVADWWLDDTGRLYAGTDLGPGMVEDRDLAALLDGMRTGRGEPLLDALETPPAAAPPLHVALAGAYPAAPLRRLAHAEVAGRLGFRAMPMP